MSPLTKRARLEDKSAVVTPEPLPRSTSQQTYDAQPPYAQPPYSQPPYAHPPYAHPAYAQLAYTRPQYAYPLYAHQAVHVPRSDPSSGLVDSQQTSHGQQTSKDNNAPDPIQQLDYGQLISQLGDKTLRDIITSLAASSPLVQDAIKSRHDQLVQARRTRVLNFDCYSKSAWHTLNTSSYTKLSGTQQWDASFEATSELEECVRAIGEMTFDESSYGTKLSALETLRKIAKTVLLADDTLGHEVRNQMDSTIADEMLRIVESMSREEQLRAGANADSKGSLAEKMQWVYDAAKANCVLEPEILYEVLELLYEESEGEDDDDDENDE
ncbi:hypothetical protein F4808DRAFT_368797 [Astrocystis sublimbata]|nr:hypothetical protein F4808DRAFT_368797 [Astrocystis sublimbata]